MLLHKGFIRSCRTIEGNTMVYLSPSSVHECEQYQCKELKVDPFNYLHIAFMIQFDGMPVWAEPVDLESITI